MKIRLLERTATFAWSQDDHIPLLATGTVAGALDASFSSTTELEIFDLSLEFTAKAKPTFDNNIQQSPQQKVNKLGGVSVNSR